MPCHACIQSWLHSGKRRHMYYCTRTASPLPPFRALIQTHVEKPVAATYDAWLYAKLPLVLRVAYTKGCTLGQTLGCLQSRLIASIGTWSICLHRSNTISFPASMQMITLQSAGSSLISISSNGNGVTVR